MEEKCLAVNLCLFLPRQSEFVLLVEQPSPSFSLRSTHTVKCMWLTSLRRTSASVDNPIGRALRVLLRDPFWLGSGLMMSVLAVTQNREIIGNSPHMHSTSKDESSLFEKKNCRYFVLKCEK